MFNILLSFLLQRRKYLLLCPKKNADLPKGLTFSSSAIFYLKNFSFPFLSIDKAYDKDVLMSIKKAENDVTILKCHTLLLL